MTYSVQATRPTSSCTCRCRAPSIQPSGLRGDWRCYASWTTDQAANGASDLRVGTAVQLGNGKGGVWGLLVAFFHGCHRNRRRDHHPHYNHKKTPYTFTITTITTMMIMIIVTVIIIVIFNIIIVMSEGSMP
jgi:hypothetical protein